MPKKAKKSGGGKMGRGESQTEEEMAKMREESLAQCLRDDLEKGEKSKTANLLRLNEGWRAILRQTRDPEFREDIIASRQMFEGQMDGLDSVIQNLLLNLQEKARQSNWVHRMHLQHLERLWDLHETQMMTVQQHWENSMQQLNSEFYTKEKRLIALSQKEPVHLVDAISSVEQDYKKVMTNIGKLYKESIKMYKQAAEAQAVSPRRRRIVRGAVQFCSKKEERLNKYIKRGQMDTEIKAEEIKKIQALKRLLAQTRKGLNKNKTRNQAEEQDLTVIRAEVNKKTEKLSQQLNESRSMARKQLINLSVQSDNPTKKLQAVIAKGEKVLRVGDMCQKLESKHKEVLSSLSSAADSETSVTEREEPGQISDFQHVHKLMVRMENALLVRDTLKKQKQALMQENQQLRLQVHQQMDDMTISDDTLDGPHALLTVSRAASITARPNPIHKQLVQKTPEAPVM